MGYKVHNLRDKPRPTKASRSMLLTMMTVIMIKNRKEVDGGDIGWVVM